MKRGLVCRVGATVACALALAVAPARRVNAAPGDVALVLPNFEPAKGTPFDVGLKIDTGTTALGGYECVLQFDPAVLQFLSATAAGAPGFSDPVRVASAGAATGYLRLGAYQRVSRTQPVGQNTLATLHFKAIGLPGSSSGLDLSVLKLLTPELDDVPSNAIDAAIVVNLLPLGDVNGDGVANQVSDAVFLTQALLGFQVLTAPESSSSDINGDGAPQTVADLVFLVNVLLGLQTPIAKATASGTLLLASLGGPQAEGDWLLVPVRLPSGETLGGALLRLALDPGRLEIGTPRLGPRAARMQVTTAQKGGELIVLVASPEGARVAAGDSPLLWLPVRPTRVDALAGDLTAMRSSAVTALTLRVADAADAAGARRVVDIAADGAEIAAMPARFALHDNVPNPFNPRTELRFDLPQAGRARLAIYDVTGRRVCTLLDRELPAGGYRLPWDGTDGRGIAVASGVYHARLEIAGQAPATRKLVLVR